MFLLCTRCRRWLVWASGGVPVGVSSALFGIVNLDQEIAADAFARRRARKTARDSTPTRRLFAFVDILLRGGGADVDVC
jgi:hypothetical protein